MMITKVTESESHNTNFGRDGGRGAVDQAEVKLLTGMDRHDANLGRPHSDQSFQVADCEEAGNDQDSETEDTIKHRWPLLFERASSAWWHPQFDSPILEQQYGRSLSPNIIKRMQFGLFYLILLATVFAIYALILLDSWVTYLTLAGVVYVFVPLVCILTTALPKVCQANSYVISIVVSLLACSSYMCIAATTNVMVPFKTLSPSAQFCIYLEVLFLIYTLFPLPLYGTVVLGTSYSFAFETLMCVNVPERLASFQVVIINILSHVCIHVIGMHIKVIIEARMRNTFMKVAQSLMVKKQLVAEKGLKEKMIDSAMPRQVAEWLMQGHKEGPDISSAFAEFQQSSNNLNGTPGAVPSPVKNGTSKGTDPDDNADSDSEASACSELDFGGAALRKISSPRSSNPLNFRPFKMNTIEDVSILFADIVGFTKMSSNKTASQLVGLLNDLFGRFDHLCKQCQCEKISTLGDCYYCVSGCPEPDFNHATNCVEMGLAMIDAIRQFDEDRNESVNMRVGIHTGTVLCGIVGKTRFKFDVWSNDVTFANKMESCGKPGKVHISEQTYGFISNEYFVEPGEMLDGNKTFFICGRTSASQNNKPLGHVEELGKSPKTSTILEIKCDNIAKEVKKAQQEALMGKSLPSLSDFFNSKKANNASENILLGAGRTITSKSSEDTEENNIANGSNTNAQKLSVLPPISLQKKKKNNQIEATTTAVDGSKSVIDTNLLSRRHSQSLPTLQPNPGLIRDGSCAMSEYDRSSGGGHLADNATVGGTSDFLQRRLTDDMALINSMIEDSSYITYFTQPPFNRITLFFEDYKVEEEYRRVAWKDHKSNPDQTDAEKKALIKTVSITVLDTYFDLVTVSLLFTIVNIDGLWGPHEVSVAWVAYFILTFVFLTASISILVKHLNKVENSSPITVERHKNHRKKSVITKIYQRCRGYLPSHLLGCFLLSIPILGVLVNFHCDLVVLQQAAGQYAYARDHFLQLVFISIAHFTSLSALSYGVKSGLATIFAIITSLLFSPAICDPFKTSTHHDPQVLDQDQVQNLTSSQNYFYFYELVTCISTLIILVWIINREFELSYRLSYLCSRLSARDKRKVQTLKNQTDWLLHNIIPRHVVESLKTNAHYSENHREVGIIFASIVNFNELYDESYNDGKEYLRVLNELISDFDDILSRSEFQNVEKIKTIGSTLMAASGMNSHVREGNTHKYQHLHELAEYSLELLRVVNDFNQSLLQFELILRVGFNFGDVTAGVIGTTKLYYDIWGDAVNIASRMDSTGIKRRIQVPERCMHILSEWYTFEQRGSIFVKGKGDMNTFLLVGRKPDSFVNAVSSIIQS